MRKTAALWLMAVLAFAACRSYPPDDVASSSPTSSAEVTTTGPVPSTSPATTARRGSGPATTARPGSGPAPARATVAPPVATAPPTTATAVLSAADASGKLCDAIISGDSAVRADNYVAGGLRLSGGISNYGEAAAPAVTSAARAMLSAGVAGDEDGYVAARAQAAPACAPFGRTVPTGGTRCITFPCP